jgi:hypothetical protein
LIYGVMTALDFNREWSRQRRLFGCAIGNCFVAFGPRVWSASD